MSRISGKHEKLLHYARLHLVGGLVGEGNGEDVTVCIPVLPAEQQDKVFSGKAESFSGAGGCLYDVHK